MQPQQIDFISEKEDCFEKLKDSRQSQQQEEVEPELIKEAFQIQQEYIDLIHSREKTDSELKKEPYIQQEQPDQNKPILLAESSFDKEEVLNQHKQQEILESSLITKASLVEQEEIEQVKQTEDLEPKIMEFTKNYSDDLLMGQSDGAQGRADMPASGVDLADFELPPYSGSSSGSEPRQSNSPIKNRKSSTSSSKPAQATSSQQHTSVGLRGLKNLLMTSYSKISHVLQWKKPIETGIYFSIGLTLITALTFFSIISVVAYSALGIIMTTGSIRVYKSIMQTLNKSPETPFDHVWDKVQNMNVTIFTEKIVEFIDASMVGNLNASLIYLKQVLLFEDKIATLKFGCYFYLLTYIGSWFNGMTLITLTYLAMFTLPIAYEKNKTQIDQYYNLVEGHVSSTTNKVSTMVFGSPKADSTSSSKKQN